MLNIIVCMKQTFDTEEKIVPDGLQVSEENVNFIINPYDEYAIEEAIRLREAHGGEVTVISIGPERVEKSLRMALAMGADKAIHIQDESPYRDEFVLSHMLAEAIKPLACDVILAGNFAIDSGSGQVAIRLAEILDIPHIGSVTRLQVDGNQVIAQRDIEGDAAWVRAALPVLITAQQGLNEPRYPSLPGIMKAKKKPLTLLAAADLLSEERAEPRTIVTELVMPPAKAPGRILTGTMAEQAAELARLLQYEAKVVG